jgi:hypothetical protein
MPYGLSSFHKLEGAPLQKLIVVDMDELRTKVKEVYRQVAKRPDGEYHFELGRALAEKLGYDPRVLDGSSFLRS